METVQTLEVIPDPVSLIESMRSVGYTVEAAVADIIDNSLSAEAARVEVLYDASNEPFVAILDDGRGMAPDELTNAMRHGSSNPADQRGAKDLGRFGLGLKTASLSQCRRLTVVSKKAGAVSARRWDLAVVRDTGRWVVVVPEAEELDQLPLFKKLDNQASGTLVVWQDLDRLAAAASDPQQEMTTKMEPLFEHLALVFHRFTQREGSIPPVSILLNGLPLPPRDPFLSSNQYRQVLEGQTINHPKGKVEISPFVLPPISNLSPDEIQLAGGQEGLRGTQGFYVYRGRRLVIWGTWFRLVPKQEFFKLTRVKVDIPNAFDELWALDIKKSAAYPPDVIRDRLRQLIPHFANTSKRTVQYAGRRGATGIAVPLWEPFEPSHGVVSYRVNSEHPLVAKLSDFVMPGGEKHLQMLLEYLSVALPYEGIYAHMCGDQRRGESASEIDELVAMARNLMTITGLDLKAVLNIDPIARFPKQHDAIKRSIENV